MLTSKTSFLHERTPALGQPQNWLFEDRLRKSFGKQHHENALRQTSEVFALVFFTPTEHLNK